MSTADAVARETAWLQRSGDGLPALPAEAGGPWGIVQAYWPRTPAYRQSGIYVLRAQTRDVRVANQRKRPRYALRLRLIWPVGSTTVATAIGETEQANLDVAVDLLIQRIRGTLGDKTHGGAFLSAGEVPGAQPEIVVDYDKPEDTIGQGYLSGTITYFIDDLEIVI